MNTYSSPQLASLFQVNEQTIRRWSDEFGKYLSIHATPAKGKPRQFTDDDLPVLALIASMKTTKAEYRDIHAALENGQRGEVPENINAIIPSPDRSALQIAQLNEVLQQTRDELIRVQTRLETETERADRAENQLKELQARYEDLLMKIGRLQGQLDRDNPSESG